jgi:hypothetical protein
MMEAFSMNGEIVVKTPILEYPVDRLQSMSHQHGQGQSRLGLRRWIRATCQRTNASKPKGMTNLSDEDNCQNPYILSIKPIKDACLISLLLIFRFVAGFYPDF